MIGIIKDINGTKQIQTLGGFTIYADLPIGSVISYMGTVDKIPLGFLYCDNTVRHKADWPELWNVLPDVLKDTVNETFTLDLRECVLVGIGQSANNYNAITNPTGIQDHDVYTLGEFKDDQLQSHTHSIIAGNSGASWGASYSQYNASSSTITMSGRTGTTTHGKQIGVNYIIKATNEWK